MDKSLKHAATKISVLMGISLSLVLSFTGTLTSGRFTVPLFLKSFLISVVISVAMGLIIPVGRVTRMAAMKVKLQPGSNTARSFESFISNLIFTPFITFIMVLVAWLGIKAHAPAPAVPQFLPMFLKSLLICFCVGYVAIYFQQPFFAKLILKDKVNEVQPKRSDLK